MATLREYFDVDLKCMTAHGDWTVKDSAGADLPPITAKVALDFDANAKYWSFFVPSNSDVGGYIAAIVSSPQTAQCVLSSEGDPIYVEMGFSGYSERVNSKTLVFTKRAFLYIDELLNPKTRKEITDYGLQHGLLFHVRDREYGVKRAELERPLAFISHDWRDKDSLVRQLALELSRLMCPVWYDEYSLKVDDSLRVSIEQGLKETKKCIVILSPNFLTNEGWDKAEFDSVYTREILDKNNILLPVWHNVGVREVYQYSPRLADRVGLSSSLGVEELASRLSAAIKQAR